MAYLVYTLLADSKKLRIMKYYNFRITNLGMGWFRWKPKYMKKNSKFDRAYFFMLNWRVEWWFTDKAE